MTKLNDRFWAKVMFEDFTNHYRKLDKEQVFADVVKSMDDLYERNPEGDSFGAFMVRRSLGRAEQYPKASDNGKKGGRPRNNPDGDASNREAEVDRKSATSPSMVKLPKNKQEVIEFAIDNGLDSDDASTWAEQNLRERKGYDKDGNPILNWKGALTNYCKAMERKRSA